MINLSSRAAPHQKVDEDWFAAPETVVERLVGAVLVVPFQMGAKSREVSLGASWWATFLKGPEEGVWTSVEAHSVNDRMEHKARTYCFPASVETTASGQKVLSYNQGTLEGGASSTAQPSTSTTVSMQDDEQCNESPAAATAGPATSFPSDVVQAPGGVPAVQQEESVPVEDEAVSSGEVKANGRLPEQKEQAPQEPAPSAVAVETAEPAPSASAEAVETAWNGQFMTTWSEIHNGFVSQVDDLTQQKLAASKIQNTKEMQEVEREFMRTFGDYLEHVSHFFREVRGAFLGMGAILLGLGEDFCIEYYWPGAVLHMHGHRN